MKLLGAALGCLVLVWCTPFLWPWLLAAMVAGALLRGKEPIR